MHKLLLCLVALAALVSADVRPGNAKARLQVRHQEEVYVTDMDRMSYDGLFTMEQTHPEDLSDDIAISDVVRIMEASMGPNWRDYVDLDDSESLTYLELIRLSTSISKINSEIAAEDVRRSGSGSNRKSNFCMCHGTASELTSTVSANGGPGVHPFKGVRIHGKGGGHIYQSGVTGHNSANKNAPYGLPRDCELCWGEVNCNACCSGPCTAGTLDDFELAVTAWGTDPLSWGARGLYQCPGAQETGPTAIAGQGTYLAADGANINDISACLFEPIDCEDAIELCDCHQRIRLLQTLQCSCEQVLVFCDSCFEAWDAIDAYKHCDCEDYAAFYSIGNGPDSEISD